MNILFIVPYVPDLIRVRPYNLVRHLSRRGHSLTLATLWSSESEYAALQSIRQDCEQVVAARLPIWRSLMNCVAALPTPTPLQAVYCWQPTLAAELDRVLAGDGGISQFDIVHVEHLRGVRYGLHLMQGNGGSQRHGNRRLPIVWDSVDSITHLFQQASDHSLPGIRRWLREQELARTRRYEGRLASVFDRVLVTSSIDREAFVSLLPPGDAGDHITVLANGVDQEYFRPADEEKREPATLIISGKMSYHANIRMVMNFFSHILPLIWAQKDDVRLAIVGKDPPKEIQALQSDPRITVTGTVSDMRPYLQKSTLAVAPLTYGAGIQNKILEAMACRTPVVTTPCAVQALSATAGVHFSVAEEPQAFARAVVDLLLDPQQRSAMGAAGYRYVQQNHNWAHIAGQLESVYRQEIDRQKALPQSV